MPCLDSTLRRAIDEPVRQLNLKNPALSAHLWESVEQGDDQIRDNFFLDGRQFLSNSLKDFVCQRAFRGPVGSYDVNKAVLSAKTFIGLWEHGGVEIDPNGSTYKAYMVFVGAALKEAGNKVMTTWFAETFGPLVLAAEAAYTAYYRLSGTSRKSRRTQRQQTAGGSQNTHSEPLYAACVGPLRNVRAKQGRKTPDHRRNHNRNSSSRPRQGLVAKVVSGIWAFATEQLPALLSEAALQDELEAFRHIYNFLQATSRTQTSTTSFASTSTSFSLNRGRNNFLAYREPQQHIV
ncbi:hypothetical protein C8R43DRAFT_1239156 [Mycena crocata]|nr:hypothetical protein C8R43DRAFT_1239156 [Mycena crocata]